MVPVSYRGSPANREANLSYLYSIATPTSRDRAHHHGGVAHHGAGLGPLGVDAASGPARGVVGEVGMGGYGRQDPSRWSLPADYRGIL